ncbi:R3H domain-containing protein 4-like [Adelges cooleyi]|uniref:R3H domain-containing protein 4-like n=1 Tax=Adelges cooleyi TaxID=133065 RepID=UPI0021802292|nr:R3H domain-containing protein 4-like [Adelges cooleyi]XP_050438228.1 R3H domain-containing protein 4-like [Adelges cooleyi]
MGITKRPASSCSDEIIAIEIDENSDNFSDTISDDSESEEDIIPNDSIDILDYVEDDSYFTIESVPNYGIQNKDETYYHNDVHVKQLFKKKISQMGRRKANRAQNEIFLLSLTDDQSPEDNIFYNDNKNGFSSVIKNCSHPALKESFIEGKEDLILQKGKESIDLKKNTKKTKRIIQPDLAFNNLTTSQKSLFKQKSLPFTTINELETEVLHYFTLVPNGIYTSTPLPGYHRLLLHGIVRYYSLDASSVNSRGHRSQKIVQVRNTKFDDFQPPNLTLLKFIETKLNKTKTVQ